MKQLSLSLSLARSFEAIPKSISLSSPLELSKGSSKDQQQQQAERIGLSLVADWPIEALLVCLRRSSFAIGAETEQLQLESGPDGAERHLALVLPVDNN